ncbi:MAG: aromatic amino acid DMT transporter YddG, partial [Gemmatimonadota bacterium]
MSPVRWSPLPRDRPTLAGAGAVLLWSISVALVRSLSEQLGPITAAAAVYLVGGGALLARLGLSAAARRRLTSLSIRYLLGCGSLFAAYILCLYLALGWAADRTQVLTVGLVNYLWPALTLVFSLPMLGHRARWSLGPATALALGGVVLAVGGGPGVSRGGLAGAVGAHPAAFACGLGAAVTWALYSNLTRRWGGAGGGGGVPFFMAGTGLVLGSLLWGLSSLAGYREVSCWSPRALAELAALSTSTALSYLGWDAAMRRGDLVFVVALSYFTPLLATLVAAAYLGAWPGLTLWLGCAFVVAGSLASWQSVH